MRNTRHTARERMAFRSRRNARIASATPGAAPVTSAQWALRAAGLAYASAGYSVGARFRGVPALVKKCARSRSITPLNVAGSTASAPSPWAAPHQTADVRREERVPGWPTGPLSRNASRPPGIARSAAASLSAPPRHACAIVKPRGNAPVARRSTRSATPRRASSAARPARSRFSPSCANSSATSSSLRARARQTRSACVERLLDQARDLGLVGHVEARVEVGLERKLAQQGQAERVDGADGDVVEAVAQLAPADGVLG